MKVFIVHAHHEGQNFNAALTKVAYQTLSEQGHSVEISDLYGMNFDPVSDRRNFIMVKNPDYFKQQELFLTITYLNDMVIQLS